MTTEEAYQKIKSGDWTVEQFKEWISISDATITAHQEGYTKGWDDGHEAGYDSGYDCGYCSATVED